MDKEVKKRKKCPMYCPYFFGLNLLVAQSASSILSVRSWLLIIRNYSGTSGAVSTDVRAPKFIASVRVWRGSRSRFVPRRIAPKITARELVSRTGICRVSACTHEEERWQEGEKDEREREREGMRREEKTYQGPRGRSHPQSSKLAGGRTCNRVSWLHRRIRYPLSFFPALRSTVCARTRKKKIRCNIRQREKLQNCTHTQDFSREGRNRKKGKLWMGIPRRN